MHSVLSAAERLPGYISDHPGNRAEEYGSAKMDERELVLGPITLVDATRVRLAADGLRAGYVHQLHYSGVRSSSGMGPLQDRDLIELGTAR